MNFVGWNQLGVSLTFRYAVTARLLLCSGDVNDLDRCQVSVDGSKDIYSRPVSTGGILIFSCTFVWTVECFE